VTGAGVCAWVAVLTALALTRHLFSLRRDAAPAPAAGQLSEELR
jgi:hypothetical protein